MARLTDGISATVNAGTSITKPTDKNIYVVAATHTFTANGVAVANIAVTGVSFGDHPLKCTTNITSATIGTVFYFIAD